MSIKSPLYEIPFKHVCANTMKLKKYLMHMHSQKIHHTVIVNTIVHLHFHFPIMSESNLENHIIVPS